MLYDCQNAITRIVGVEHLQWKQGTFHVKARDYSALAFRIKGTATITVEETDYLVDTNDILYLPQNLSYAAHYSDTEMIVIHFHTAADDRQPQVFSLSDTAQIYQAFLAAYTLWQKKEPGYIGFVLGQSYDILGQICVQKPKEKLPDCIAKAIAYINANFKNNTLCIDDICRETGMSATYLRTLFQKHLSKRPTEYVISLRLEHARNLIACGTSVKEAAFESGFNDPKYFARAVKKHFHCTPRELQLYGK